MIFEGGKREAHGRVPWASPVSLFALFAFAFVIDVGRPSIVLSDFPNEEWATGAPKLAHRGDPWTTRLATSNLPPELASWRGRKVELFDQRGAVCEGTVDRLSMVGRVIPHFGRVSQWSGTGDFAGQPKASQGEIAEDAWGLSGNLGGGERNGRVLVGEIKAEKGDCKGALWGRPVQPTKPVIVPGTNADPATRALAFAALKKTTAFAATQARYASEKQPTDPAHWEDFDAHVEARTFRHPSGTTIVTLSITSGVGCGSFGATLSAAWESKNGALVTVREPDERALVPVSASDVDGDGSIELLFEEGVLQKSGGSYTKWEKLEIPFLDCGC